MLLLLTQNLHVHPIAHAALLRVSAIFILIKCTLLNTRTAASSIVLLAVIDPGIAD